MSTRQVLVVIIAVAVLLRLGLSIYLGDSIADTRGGTYDQVSYDALAQRLVDGHGFSFAEPGWPYVKANKPTAFWSYLYTIFLAGTYGVFGHHPFAARVIQAVIVGMVMPLFLFRIGRYVFDERIGLIAAAIAAFYAYFVTFAGALMTESFYIVCILWTVDAALRISHLLGQAESGDVSQRRSLVLRYGLELGMAFGLTILLRQVVAPFFGVLVLWLFWRGWQLKKVRPVLQILFIALLIAVLLIVPFILRNYNHFGQLTFMPNTNAGFAFYWSNHPIYGTTFEPVLSESRGVAYQDLIPEELRDLNEVELDRELMVRGIQFVSDEPARYLLLSLSRIPIYFQFWPTADSSPISNAARVMSFGLFLPFMILGLLLVLVDLLQVRRHLEADKRVSGSAETRARYVVLILSFVAIYTAIHLASWANMRYRLPVDAFLILFAAYAINWVAAKWRGSDTRLVKAEQIEDVGEYSGV